MSAPAEFGMSSRGIPFAGGAARSPDRSMFDRWAREHTPTLLRLAVKLTETRSDAEDLVQETFLRAWKGLGKFRGDAEPRTWLYRILVNASHRIRKRARRPVLDPPRKRVADPAEAFGRRELLGRVLEAVDSLPRRQRETLLLRASAGLSYRQISLAMSIKQTAVKSHLVQARRKLLRRFGREAMEWGIATE